VFVVVVFVFLADVVVFCVVGCGLRCCYLVESMKRIKSNVTLDLVVVVVVVLLS